MKQCFTCKETKPLTEFQKKASSKDGLHPNCKLCKQAKERAVRSPEYSRRSNLKRNFNITPEEYDMMLAKQVGVCAICKQAETSKRTTFLAVDHCHTTGAIRGLLCNNCNRGIGLLKDSPELLQAAKVYLEKV